MNARLIDLRQFYICQIPIRYGYTVASILCLIVIVINFPHTIVSHTVVSLEIVPHTVVSLYISLTPRGYKSFLSRVCEIKTGF